MSQAAEQQQQKETISLEEHEREIEAIELEYEERERANKILWDERERELLEKVSSAETSTALVEQDLAILTNQYAHFENKLTGVMRSGPKEWESAVDIYDYQVSRVGILTNAKPYFHPGRQWPPFWQIFLGIIGIIFVGAIVWPGSTFGKELGIALQNTTNQYVLITAIIAVTIIVVVSARKSRSGGRTNY